MIRVHCFFCPETVEAADPDSAHALMESHYAAAHQAQIDRIVAS